MFEIKFCNQKDFVFLSLSVKCISWKICDEIVENQDAECNVAGYLQTEGLSDS